MSAVFSHGRLRLYLLKLLAEGPKHGYELIRSLENRFYGLYAPSAGTIYPRLARMEGDGLITHTAAGGRKTYEITAKGRAELAQRADELGQLEREIHTSVADLAALAEEVEQGVRGSVRDLKRELRTAKHEAAPIRQDWRELRDQWHGTSAPPPQTASPAATDTAATGTATTGTAATGHAATGTSPTGTAAAGLAVEVVRKAADLAAEVDRLVALGRATPEDVRMAGSVLDSVRDQLRHILRG